MTTITQTHTQVQTITILIGLVSFCCLLFVHINTALSFAAGLIISLGYLWHLRFSVSSFNSEKKRLNSAVRLLGTGVLIMSTTAIFHLSLLWVVLGFIINHLAMVLVIGITLFKSKAENR